jgi:hypothetical protein
MRNAKATAAVSAAAVCIYAVMGALPGFAARQAPAAQEQQKASAAEIVLPPQLETEKPATLAVLDSEGRLMVGITVVLSNGKRVTTDSTGRARFVVTSEPGTFSAEVEGGGVRASADVLAMQTALPEGIVVTNYPHVAAVQDHIAVRGAGFRGDADLNRVTLQGQPALVLASSTVSLVMMAGPNATPGPADFVVEVSDHKCGPLPLTLVSLEIEGPAGKLARGKKSQLILHIRGTEEKLALALRNLSPESVELIGGNMQRVVSSGGSQNKANVGMRGVREGEFSVSVRLVPTASGAPDLALVRRELLAARGMAAGEWVARMDGTIQRLDHVENDPHGSALMLQDLAGLFSLDPPKELARHLQAAWLALLYP